MMKTRLPSKSNKDILLESQAFSVGIFKRDNNFGFELGCIAELFVNKINEIDIWYQGQFIDYEQFNESSVARMAATLLQYDMLVLTDSHCLNRIYASNLLKSLSLFQQAGGRIVAFGSGIAVLAEAGLLDGKTVPHISSDNQVAVNFPNVNFCSELSFSKGPQIYCASCGFKVLELCLFIIGKDLGIEAVRTVVSDLNLAPNLIDSTDQQLAIANGQENKEVNLQQSRISLATQWAKDNIKLVDNVDQLAERAFLSRRSFDRQFRAVMGLSAKDWLTQQRLTLAKQHLQDSCMSIEQIATETGFGNSNNFRNNFIKAIGLSPSDFRLSVVNQ